MLLLLLRGTLVGRIYFSQLDVERPMACSDASAVSFARPRARFHPDLRGARWLPGGVGHPLLVWLMRRLPLPSVRLPPRLTLSERRVDDAGNVRVRVIAPRADGAPRPALLWIHGGGYVLGSAQQDDRLCARFAERLDIVVVSVDYRLAPEHPYPTPLEDCFAAFEFLHRHAGELGIDPARVVDRGPERRWRSRGGADVARP